MQMIADLRDNKPSGLFYGGRAGQKEGILIDGEPWIAKYPRTTRDLVGKHLPPYTSSPVSEYLGSKIYKQLGIPTHEVMLGYRNGKIVCACKDFTYPNKRLFEFREIKNAMSDDNAGFSSAPSDGEVVLLSDVLATIETSPLLKQVEGVRERFWDMFVVDAFLKNPDRNNGNWGILMQGNPLDGSATYELAPVYDLGSSLFSKRSASLAEVRLTDERAIEEDAFGTNISCYRLLNDDGTSHAIHPFEYMSKTENPDLEAAIGRFLKAANMMFINMLIDNFPEEAYGIVLMSEGTRESHKRLLQERYDRLRRMFIKPGRSAGVEQ